MTEQKHWAADKSARDRLLAFGVQHGLDGKGVVSVLGVKKLSDYAGTEAEAVATIAKWAQAQVPPEPEPHQVPELDASDEDQAACFEACTQLPEAPVVAWTTFQDRRGYEWSYTIRAGLPASQSAIVHRLVAFEIAAFDQDATRYGWMPLIDTRRVGNGNGAKPATPVVKTTAPPIASGNGSLTFEASKLVANVNEGNVYWKVKGGKFSRHGVTIWPEVLEAAGFEPDNLDPTETYSLSGSTAHYVVNENGNPQKVIKLERAA